MFGMMPWGNAVDLTPSGPSGVFHFDGNINNAVAGGFGLSQSGSPTFVSGRFSSGLQWDVPGKLFSPVITSVNRVNGVMVHGWVKRRASGFAIFSGMYDSGNNRVCEVVIDNINGFSLVRSGGSQDSVSGWSYGDWIHLCWCIKTSSETVRSSLAVNGVWGLVDRPDSTLSIPSSPCYIAIADEVSLGSTAVAIYDEVVVTLGATNFPFTPGVNFTPPTSPLSL